MIIEIRKGPDKNGNFKRLYIEYVPGGRCIVQADDNVLRGDLFFTVTAAEFKAWDEMRKAQEKKR